MWNGEYLQEQAHSNRLKQRQEKSARTKETKQLEKRRQKEAAAAARNASAANPAATLIKQEPGLQRATGSHPSTPTGSEPGSRVTTPGLLF